MRARPKGEPAAAGCLADGDRGRSWGPLQSSQHDSPRRPLRDQPVRAPLQQPRLDRDIEIAVKHKVPIWINSLVSRVEVNEAAHSCGGIVLQ